jgi:hypothetical protein
MNITRFPTGSTFGVVTGGGFDERPGAVGGGGVGRTGGFCANVIGADRLTVSAKLARMQSPAFTRSLSGVGTAVAESSPLTSASQALRHRNRMYNSGSCLMPKPVCAAHVSFGGLSC